MSLYWINNADSFRLAIAARPRGEDWLCDDLKRLRDAGIDVLVSMLTPAEAIELGLQCEREECRKCGIEFINFAVEDRSVPENLAEFRRLIDLLVSQLKTDKALAVHCRAGIGRSSLVACSVLVRLGIQPSAAWSLLQNARGCVVPDTSDQQKFVDQVIAYEPQ